MALDNQNEKVSLNSKMKIGLKWNLFNQVATQFVFIWFSIYLARLLGPEAYGLVGMVTVLSGFAGIFVDFGFAASVIYYQVKSDLQLSSVFWFNVMIGVFIYSLFFLLAPWIAHFYDEPQLEDLTRVICLGILISSFSSLQGTLLSKEINFKKKVLIQWCSTIIGYSLGFYLAFCGFGVWSIVFMTLSNSIVNTIILWSTSKWKPSFQFSYAELKPLTKYSVHIGSTSIFSYLTRNLDNFIVAKFIGGTALGLYSNAYRLMMLPITNISGIFNNVLFSGFSKMGNDKEKMAAVYLKTISLISFITFPLMVMIFSVAEELVLVFYGEEWGGAIPLIRILSLLGAVQSILFLNGTIYNSVGKPKIALYVTIGMYMLLVPAWIIGLKLNGIIGFCQAYFLVSGIGSIFTLYIAIREIQLTLMNIMLTVYRAFLGSVILGLMVFLISFLIKKNNLHFTLGLKLMIGGFTYLIYSILFQKDMLYKMINIKKQL